MGDGSYILTAREVLLPASLYLPTEMVCCVTKYRDGNTKADPTEGLMHDVGNTRSASEDVAVRPSLVLADTRALAFGVVDRSPSPPPEGGAAVVPAHSLRQVGF